MVQITVIEAGIKFVVDKDKGKTMRGKAYLKSQHFSTFQLGIYKRVSILFLSPSDYFGLTA
jgi:hypothetical protein